MATTEDFMITIATTIPEDLTSETTIEYSDYYEDEMCDETSVKHFGVIFTPVFFSIVVILSLFGNILIMVILAKYENLRYLTNAFILNLAVSDLLFTAGLPFWAYYHTNGWTLGEPACKVVNFVFYVGFYSSSIFLILMTIQRFVAVMNPLSEIVSTKGFCSVQVSVIIWAVSIFIASPTFIFTKVLDMNYCGYAKSYWTLWGFYQQNILFVVSSVVFVFCYSQIIWRLLHPTVQRRRNKTLKLIFTLMVVFFVGWAPFNIVIFLKSFSYWDQEPVDSGAFAAICETKKTLEYALYISRVFAFSHCCLNPVLYVFVGIKFKNHLKRMLMSWGNNRNSIHSRQSRLTITSLTGGEELSM